MNIGLIPLWVLCAFSCRAFSCGEALKVQHHGHLPRRLHCVYQVVVVSPDGAVVLQDVRPGQFFTVCLLWSGLSLVNFSCKYN